MAVESLGNRPWLSNIPQSRLHQWRNFLGISPPVPPPLELHQGRIPWEFLHWCKTSAKKKLSEVRNQQFTGAGNKSWICYARNEPFLGDLLFGRGHAEPAPNGTFPGILSIGTRILQKTVLKFQVSSGPAYAWNEQCPWKFLCGSTHTDPAPSDHFRGSFPFCANDLNKRAPVCKRTCTKPEITWGFSILCNRKVLGCKRPCTKPDIILAFALWCTNKVLVHKQSSGDRRCDAE